MIVRKIDITAVLLPSLLLAIGLLPALALSKKALRIGMFEVNSAFRFGVDHERGDSICMLWNVSVRRAVRGYCGCNMPPVCLCVETG